MGKVNKNTYRFEDGYVVVGCTPGNQEFIVDDADFDIVKNYVCHIHKNYVYISERRKYRSLSHELTGSPSNRKVLYRNGNSLDLRRKNLFSGNTYRPEGDYLVGECFTGQEYKIDVDDYNLVSQYVWHVDANGYVITKVNGRVIKQHRLVMGIVDDDRYEVDHIEHDTLDNRKSKLRLADRSLNCFNRRIGKGNRSGIIGVFWMSSANKWAAQIAVDKNRHYLGVFDSKEDAAAARKKAENELYLTHTQQSEISSQALNKGRFNDYPSGVDRKRLAVEVVRPVESTGDDIVYSHVRT